MGPLEVDRDAPAYLSTEEFGQRMEAVALGEVLLNAGQYQEAARVLDEEYLGQDVEVVAVEVDGQVFEGQQTTLDVRGQRVSFFTGVARDALGRALQRSPQPLPTRAAQADRGLVEAAETSSEDVIPVAESPIDWGLSAPDDSGYLVGCWRS
jgi:hypothetical protein